MIEMTLNQRLIAAGPVTTTFTSENLKIAYGEVIGQLVKGAKEK